MNHKIRNKFRATEQAQSLHVADVACCTRQCNLMNHMVGFRATEQAWNDCLLVCALNDLNYPDKILLLLLHHIGAKLLLT